MARKKITVEPSATINTMDHANPSWWALGVRDKFAAFERASQDAVEAAIELGRELLEAKENLGHGQFLRMFSDHADPIAEALPFGRIWAQKLMNVAKSPTLTNENHGYHLPRSVWTLAELSRLDDSDLQTAIEVGAVHPKITRSQAKALVSDRLAETRKDAKPIAPSTTVPLKLPAQVTATPEADAVKETEEERLFRLFTRFKDGFRRIWADNIYDNPTLHKPAASHVRMMLYTLTGTNE